MLHKSSEKVRAAQLGVIKCLLYETEPSRIEDEDEAKKYLIELHAAKQRWENISVSEIIELYSGEAEAAEIVVRKKWSDFRPR
jgi:hypothetical protein